MARKDIKIYRYSRGDEYSCTVVVINGEHIVFDNIKYPATASVAVVEKLLDDAERESLKHFNRTGT